MKRYEVALWRNTTDFLFSINKPFAGTQEGLWTSPCVLRLFLNECLRFVLFEVVPQREIKTESLSTASVFPQTLHSQPNSITSASHYPFNEQNKFWQLTSSLSPSNTSTLICWWLGATVPPSPVPPGRFVFVFIILQLSQMTVISWIGDTYWRSQPITRRRKGRLFVAFTNRTVWARESLQTCHNFMH